MSVQHFGMSLRRSLSLLAAGALFATSVTPALAATDIRGRWDSNSLRDNEIGYFLTLTPTPQETDTYSGVLRFEYRDGRRGPRMKVTAELVGTELTLRATSGRFDKGSGSLRAVITNDGSTLTMTNCRERLRLVMVNALDSDCVFQRADID